MLQINGKTFMNLQEAVQWLLDNNALPFQSSANYVANTEIGLGTIVNPSPAKVRIGSLIFFADSKVSTVIGLTENGFICSDQYNNLVDDIAYVTNVSIDASGHLITTLSDRQSIDAGQIKQVSGFSIDASQHLIVSFNDGTSTDLGAIFNGNVNIAGNLTADSIIENMSGYSANLVDTDTKKTISNIYTGAVKNGNKLTLVTAVEVTISDVTYNRYAYLCSFTIPSAIGALLYPAFGSILDTKNLIIVVDGDVETLKEGTGYVQKAGGQTLYFRCKLPADLELGKTYYIRYEATFLLSAGLI